MSAEYSELITRLEDFKERLGTLCEAIEVEKGLEQITELEGRMANPAFWNNNEKAQRVIRELKALRGVAVPLKDLSQNSEDLLELAKLAQECLAAQLLATLVENDTLQVAGARDSPLHHRADEEVAAPLGKAISRVEGEPGRSD